MSFFRNQLEAWLKMIDVKADSVLDVGGAANLVKDRVKSWDVANYRILDNGAEVNNNIVEGLLYFNDLNEPIELDQRFDVVFCLEVFEYIWNPVQAMQNLSNLVKDDGILYISFPTIYPLHNPPQIDYLRYTKNGVQKLLEVAGFNRWEITPRIPVNYHTLQKFYSEEGMHPLRGTMDIYDIGYCVKAWREK